ncbi:MAG: protein kinase [Acidobacteria bacterium]|nr:protein kinase [Acidobacteriota bacterium]
MRRLRPAAVTDRLHQYRIESRLGEGGMGVVYRARDERLERTVAIKLVGGDAATNDVERRQILDEARAAAQLSHPHICTIYEVGETDTRAFIVMEFIDGRPLSELIPHDGLPFHLLIRYASEVAAALGHAHQRGVVHRDLKTANIVISPQAGAKVLDFGLARRLEVGADVRTRSIAGVESDAIAGTLAYLPPEVLLGAPADARADIWALGVVLFEMAAAEPPFKGRNHFELTAAILRESAAPLPPRVPPGLRAVILRCLAKRPEQRYQHAGEVHAALEAISSGDAVAVAPLPTPSRSRRRLLAAIAVGLPAAVGAVAAYLLLRPSSSAPAPGGQLARLMESQDRTFDPSLSADGRMLCYAFEDVNGRRDLVLTRVAGGGRISLTTDDAIEESPAFSPDGEWIAFTRRATADVAPEIRVIPALGGEVASTIAAAAAPAWGPDGKRLVYVRRSSATGLTELILSDLDGSNSRTLLQSDSRFPFLSDPAWSPDGATVAVVRGLGGVAAQIWLVPVNGGTPRVARAEPATVFSDSPVFTTDGRGIVYVSNRGGAVNVWYQPLGSGEPVRLTTGPGPDGSPTVAADGSIAFVNSRWRNTLEVRDLEGGASRTLLTHTPYLWSPAVSMDGAEVAFSRGEMDGTWQVWTVPIEGGTPRRLTAVPSGAIYPQYTPDGAFVLFNSWSEPRQIGRVPRSGGPVEIVVSDGAYGDMSPDGQSLAFVRKDASAERIYVSLIGDPGRGKLLTGSSGTVPRWSPDGRWIAFAADRGYAGGIHVVGRDGKGERRLTRDGGWPVWFPDGRRIGYLAIGPRGDQEYRITDVDGSAPRAIPDLPLRGTNLPFTPSRDGRFIVFSNAVHVSDEIWLLKPAR